MGLLKTLISVLSMDMLLKYPERLSFVLLTIPYDPERHKFLFKFRSFVANEGLL
jgi:hypothetical protein